MNAKKPQEPKKPLNSTCHPEQAEGAVKDLSAIVKDPSVAKFPQDDEFGGRGGAEPTRFGDYEINGKCVDF